MSSAFSSFEVIGGTAAVVEGFARFRRFTKEMSSINRFNCTTTNISSRFHIYWVVGIGDYRLQHRSKHLTEQFG